MTSLTVECRERDATVNNANGDWTTILQEHIPIEAGDQIMVKQSFVDTFNTTQTNVVVAEDTELTVHFMRYMVNWRNSPNKQLELNSINPNVAVSDYDPKTFNDDGDVYLDCVQIESSGNDSILKSIEWKTHQPSIGSFHWNLTYKPPGATDFTTQDCRAPGIGLGEGKVTVNLDIPFVTADGVRFSASEGSLQAFLKKNKLISGGVYIDSNGFIAGSDVIQQQLAQPIIRPTYLSKTIKLEKGQYAPDDLAKTINREMSVNLGGTNLSSNPLLGMDSFTEGDWGSNGTVLATNVFSNERVWVNTKDKDKYFKIQNTGVNVSSSFPQDPDEPYKSWLGTNEFELSFDVNTNRFYWEYLHFPYYDTTGAEVVKYITFGNDIKPINKNSGIFLTGLTATNTSGKTLDFWSKELGFRETFGVIPSYAQSTVWGTDTLVPQILDAQDGDNMTGAFVGLDTAVNKATAFWEVPTSNPVSTVDATTPIYASHPIGLDSFGYFLIEVNAKFMNRFLTPHQNFGNIQQIVSRYYEINSFTTGADGSLIYTHQGEPMMLSSFQCRILESNKELSSSIGNNSTIFITIEKSSSLRSKRAGAPSAY